MEWQPVILSLKVAFTSLGLVFVAGTAAAVLMRKAHFPGKAALEAFFTLPLVLPPVVTGFLLLLLIGKQGPVGRILDQVWGIQLIFTPYAAVLAGAVVAFPLMYQSVKAAFQSIDTTLEDAARTLGSGEWRIFWTVTMPLAKHGLLAGLVLAFSRALGEFGATIMVAGNIPGKTETIPLAIYFAAESNDLNQAGFYVLIISALSFLLIFGLNLWNKWRGNESLTREMF
ncbi:molybdate abc transporter permease protein [Lucifera butyrica]|uniref:Molybdenum transport system permease n=1 Tax=Lucifera butyrica TaxID=1351585 RepID=A0A498R4Q1_9FIRM|nr:molybdate ABC transporter permease subunit [Lucifera butyrica]VBB07666.1 molybdate abc transporter permease protein [Lucifera butyrica]